MSSIDVFCSKHSDCEAPISVITRILSQNDPLKFQNISNEFEKLEFKKVKDLAGATLGKASLIELSGDDTLTLLYGAIEIFSKYLDNLLKSAESEYQKGNFINTQNICKKLLAYKPIDLNVLMLNAKSFFNCEKYDECIDCLKKAININPECCNILNNFALVYMKKSENDLAKHYLLDVCSRKRFCDVAWTNYTDFLIETNDLSSAKLAYEYILSLKPELYEVRSKYGSLLLKLQEVEEAKKEFEIAHNSAIESKQENLTILRHLANIYCLQGNMLLSAETYKKCLKLEPENLDLNLELGLIYLHNIKNYSEAAIFFKKCTEINPERIDLYEKLFTAYHLANDFHNASDACMCMGDLYLELDDNENARNSFYCAIHFNPDNEFSHWKLGLTMYRLGHSDFALKRYMHVISLDPEFADAYCDMGVIFEERGLFEKAIKYYKLAIKLAKTSHFNAELNLADIGRIHEMTHEDATTDNEKL